MSNESEHVVPPQSEPSPQPPVYPQPAQYPPAQYPATQYPAPQQSAPQQPPYQQPAPQPQQPPYQQPQGAQPPYGAPQYGAPQYGNPQYGTPQYPDPNVPVAYPGTAIPGGPSPQYPSYMGPSAYAHPGMTPTAGPGGIAIAALIVGIVAFLSGWVPFFGLIVAAAGIVLGVFALRQPRGKGFGITALVLSGLAAITGIFMLVLYFGVIGTSGSYY